MKASTKNTERLPGTETLFEKQSPHTGNANIIDKRASMVVQRKLKDSFTDQTETKDTLDNYQSPLKRGSIADSSNLPIQCYRNGRFEDEDVIETAYYYGENMEGFIQSSLNQTNIGGATYDYHGEYRWKDSNGLIEQVRGFVPFNPKQRQAIEHLDSEILNKRFHPVWNEFYTETEGEYGGSISARKNFIKDVITRID